MTLESAPDVPATSPFVPASELPGADNLDVWASGVAAAPSPADELRTENLALANRLREALLATDAAIVPELLIGETVAEIEASYAAAKALAERVRESVRRETLAAGAGVVPAGSPGRSQARPLNARDKIRAGLSRPAGSGGSTP